MEWISAAVMVAFLDSALRSDVTSKADMRRAAIRCRRAGQMTSLSKMEGWALADEFNDLRLFVRMAAAGSLSETARRLNTSLPAMSRRLAAMETRLGVRLIDRSTRRFALTEEGVILHERAVGLLSELDELEAAVSAANLTPHGHIRVGAPLEIGRRRIAPLVAQFSADFPQITVELALSDAAMNVVADDLDVGIHVDQPTDGATVARKLLTSRRAICASPDYLAQHGAPSKPDDLAAHECIRLVRGRRVMDRWLFTENGDFREVHVHGSLMTNTPEVAHEWALAGRGIALKAQWHIQEDLDAGRLNDLLQPFACDPINLYVMYARRLHLPKRVRLFIDFMRGGLGGDHRLVPGEI